MNNKTLNENYQKALYYITNQTFFGVYEEDWQRKLKRYEREMIKRGFCLPEYRDLNASGYAPLLVQDESSSGDLIKNK